MASDKNNTNKETFGVLAGCGGVSLDIARGEKKGKDGELGGFERGGGIKCQSCASGSTMSSECGSKLSTAAGLPVSWYNRRRWQEGSGRAGET